LAYLIGGVAFIMAISALLVAIVALRKVQALTVEFVKAHVQGIRTDAAKQTMDMKVLTQRIDKMERAAAKARTQTQDVDVPAPH
jgi:hypothetical protein